LASPLFHKIRGESHILHEGMGGCALRVESSVKKGAAIAPDMNATRAPEIAPLKPMK
jgi:hypothetical protein